MRMFVERFLDDMLAHLLYTSRTPDLCGLCCALRTVQCRDAVSLRKEGRCA